MYERFTDRARTAMQYANQEAVRCNHEFVGPEHILAGIALEGCGVACEVLKAKEISRVAIVGHIGRLVPDGPEINRGAPSPRPQTPLARKIVECAMEIASEMRNGYVGTEHLLLAILKEPGTVAWTVLTTSGLTYETVLNDIQTIPGRYSKSAPQAGTESQLWIDWQNVVAALPAMVRAITRAAKEVGPQVLSAPVTLKPETVELIVEAQLALDGKMPNASLQPATP